VTTSRWDPEAPGYYGPGTTIWESRTTWYQVLAAGPAIGLEAGALSHLSLNLEVGYRAAYDFAQSDTAKALALGPSFSAMVLFRF
jgi:hypothetical protein